MWYVASFLVVEGFSQIVFGVDPHGNPLELHKGSWGSSCVAFSHPCTHFHALTQPHTHFHIFAHPCTFFSCPHTPSDGLAHSRMPSAYLPCSHTSLHTFVHSSTPTHDLACPFRKSHSFVHSGTISNTLACMAWRAILGPLSKRKRRLDSLEAAQGAPWDGPRQGNTEQ